MGLLEYDWYDLIQISTQNETNLILEIPVFLCFFCKESLEF